MKSSLLIYLLLVWFTENQSKKSFTIFQSDPDFQNEGLKFFPCFDLLIIFSILLWEKTGGRKIRQYIRIYGYLIFTKKLLILYAKLGLLIKTYAACHPSISIHLSSSLLGFTVL